MGNDRTISFSVWPHLITLEGPASALATLVEQLYNDARLPRDKWSLASATGLGRTVLADRLRAHGKLVRRIGVAALTSEISNEIERRARGAGLKCNALHMPEKR